MSGNLLLLRVNRMDALTALSSLSEAQNNMKVYVHPFFFFLYFNLIWKRKGQKIKLKRFGKKN
jgi:hypothetical protein